MSFVPPGKFEVICMVASAAMGPLLVNGWNPKAAAEAAIDAGVEVVARLEKRGIRPVGLDGWGQPADAKAKVAEHQS